MLAPHCPVHGRRVLLGHDDITSVRNANDATVVEWTCSCGHRGQSRFEHRRATVAARAGRLLV